MQVSFLLGPAGSGKTWRCLNEVRAELRNSPDGPPLVVLAPKQATFQLERQLLQDGSLPGYTRLHILSFERLAEFIFERLQQPVPDLLSESGRVMVLRALLAQRQAELKVFRATARLPGFARQLSSLLRELQRHQLTAARLGQLSQRQDLPPRLADKLHDLALVLGACRGWLKAQHLQDSDSLLDLAAEALDREPAQPHSSLRIAGLWLDGFAEMTPQELGLLARLSPFCAQATLAFCLESEPGTKESWLSPWTVIGATYRRCRAALEVRPENRVMVEVLTREASRGRFAGNEMLAHLERGWAKPAPFVASAGAPPAAALRLVACATPEAEAVFAAREILRYVREHRGRFRDCAVLLRSLESYHDPLRSVFSRYGIPFFLDRREPVAHHPLAELTRYALRTVTFGWQPEDWFGALKTSLVPASDSDIDRLENEALAHGLEGRAWQEPLPPPENVPGEHPMEWLRRNLVPPFTNFQTPMAEAGFQPTGAQLAKALRALWNQLDVEQTLQRWSEAASSSAARAAIHLTVLEQMNDWLANLERAFAGESMPLREWLAIVEAGLSGLTVGVIPPALDQVLIGAIDRSRHPDLRRVFVLGLNEGVFPAPPPAPVLLTDAERDQLALQGFPLGASRQQQLGHERYFGYIAATRASEQTVFTFARRDADGTALNPSLFIAHLENLFPGLAVESAPGTPALTDCQHACELVAPLIQAEAHRDRGAAAAEPWLRLAALPAFQSVLAKAAACAVTSEADRIAPASAAHLFGPELAVSINALESFAECPFKFFVGRGLRAQERLKFEPDVRERGSFQHEILKEFHHRLQAYGQRWRDVSPPEAQVRIRQIGEDLLQVFRDGLFASRPDRRFQAELLIEGLERLIGVLVGWMPQYQFDPRVAELDFGLGENSLPGWRVPLADGHALVLRGRIDRVDLCYPADDETALVVVIDYKSSEHKLDVTRLHHGLQLQLLGYLNALRHLENPREFFHVDRLVPAGVFYVNLKGRFRPGHTRADVLVEPAENFALAFQHQGRFNHAFLEYFDHTGRPQGDQFRYRENADGNPAKSGNDALPASDFEELLAQSEAHIRRIGDSIYGGVLKADPFRLGSETACQHCDYRSICRFDPWLDSYRVLRPPPKPAGVKPASGSRRARPSHSESA